jgi:predicted HD superfamily hydrolase involved in NAD metabolism
MQKTAKTDKISTEQIAEVIRMAKPPRRYEHTMRVLDMAIDLARRCGADAEKARVAALFHDFCKDCLKPGNDLSHAEEAAERMRFEYGIADEDILNAVRYHTTGRAGMSKLELVIFLADTLEPSRTYEDVDRLRGLVYEDLYAGALEVMKSLNAYLIKEGKAPAQDSLDAIDWLERIVRDHDLLNGKNRTE